MQCEATTLIRQRCDRTSEADVNGHGYCGQHAVRERRKGTLDQQLDAWLRQNPRTAAPARRWIPWGGGMSWDQLSDDEQRTVVQAARIGGGGSITADTARSAIDWAAAVRRSGTVKQAARLAAVPRGEVLLVPRREATAA